MQINFQLFPLRVLVYYSNFHYLGTWDGQQDKLASVLLLSSWGRRLDPAETTWHDTSGSSGSWFNMSTVITVWSQWKETDVGSVFLTSRARLSLTKLMNHSSHLWRRRREDERPLHCSQSELHSFNVNNRQRNLTMTTSTSSLTTRI